MSTSLLVPVGSRWRRRSDFTLTAPFTKTDTAYDASSGTTAVLSTVAIRPKVGIDRAMEDWIVPKYAQRVRQGEVFFLPMTSYSFRYHCEPGTGQILRRTSGSDIGDTYTLSGSGTVAYMDASGTVVSVNGIVQCQELISGPNLVPLIDECSTRVLSERGRSDVNQWENLAQLNSTLALLAKPLSAFGSLQRKLSLLAGTLTAAQLWLQYRYGILPLVRDVEQILKDLDRNVKGPTRKTTRASESLSSEFSRDITVSGSPMSFTFRQQITESVTIRAMSLDEFVRSASDDFGFGAKNLFTLPWELIPYSFVADWFANVGDFIGSLAPALGYTQLGGCVTINRERKAFYLPVNTSLNSTPGWALDRPVSGTFQVEITARSRLGLGAAGLVIKNDFRLDSIVRLSDAFALAAQRIIQDLGRTQRR
jgi:hypothetical protein